MEYFKNYSGTPTSCYEMPSVSPTGWEGGKGFMRKLEGTAVVPFKRLLQESSWLYVSVNAFCYTGAGLNLGLKASHSVE